MGVVTGASPFGLFVCFTIAGDGQNRTALVPRAAVSPGCVDDISEVATVGQRVRVRVIEVKGFRITCSMLTKQTVTPAWKDVQDTEWFRGNITAVSSNYAMVQVQRSTDKHSVQGDVSASNVWLDNQVASLGNLTQGQEVWVRVTSVKCFWAS